MSSTAQADGKLTAARAAFIGFFGLALGWAGVLVAAVAVAAERAKNGDDTVDESRHKTGSSGWWSQWRANQSRTQAERNANARRWLEQDRQERAALVEQRKQWRAAGADPAAEPRKPGYARRLGRGARRAAHRRRLAAAKVRTVTRRFVSDFKEGWRTASEHAGEGFRAAARTRPPTVTGPAGPVAEPVDAEIVEPEVVDAEVVEPGNPNQAPAPQPPADDQVPPADDQVAPADGAPVTADGAPAPSGTTTETGDPKMPIPTNAEDIKANSNPQVADGDDHLDRISSGLGNMGETLARGDEHTDALMALARQLRAQAAATMERAGDKATTQTRQACDQALAQAATYEAAAAQVAEASAATAESIEAADRGLDPARQARDELHTAGATGELLSTAQDG
jgi:hypothetical protein